MKDEIKHLANMTFLKKDLSLSLDNLLVQGIGYKPSFQGCLWRALLSKTSFKISLFSVRFATAFFKRPFSLSGFLRRLACETFILP